MLKNVDLLVYFEGVLGVALTKIIGLYHIRYKKRIRNIITETTRIINDNKKKEKVL